MQVLPAASQGPLLALVPVPQQVQLRGHSQAHAPRRDPLRNRCLRGIGDPHRRNQPVHRKRLDSRPDLRRHFRERLQQMRALLRQLRSLSLFFLFFRGGRFCYSPLTHRGKRGRTRLSRANSRAGIWLFFAHVGRSLPQIFKSASGSPSPPSTSAPSTEHAPQTRPDPRPQTGSTRTPAQEPESSPSPTARQPTPPESQSPELAAPEKNETAPALHNPTGGVK